MTKDTIIVQWTAVVAVLALAILFTPQPTLLPAITAAPWLAYAIARGSREVRALACAGLIAAAFWTVSIFAPYPEAFANYRHFASLVAYVTYSALTVRSHKLPAYIHVLAPLLFFTLIISVARCLIEVAIPQRADRYLSLLMLGEYILQGLVLTLGSFLGVVFRRQRGPTGPRQREPRAPV